MIFTVMSTSRRIENVTDFPGQRNRIKGFLDKPVTPLRHDFLRLTIDSVTQRPLRIPSLNPLNCIDPGNGPNATSLKRPSDYV